MVYELGIEIDVTIPFNSVESNTDTFELRIVRYFLEYPEIEIGLYIKNAFFAIVKCDCKREIFTRKDCHHSWIHGILLVTEEVES